MRQAGELVRDVGVSVSHEENITKTRDPQTRPDKKGTQINRKVHSEYLPYFKKAGAKSWLFIGWVNHSDCQVNFCDGNFLPEASLT